MLKDISAAWKEGAHEREAWIAVAERDGFWAKRVRSAGCVFQLLSATGRWWHILLFKDRSFLVLFTSSSLSPIFVFSRKSSFGLVCVVGGSSPG